MSLLDDSVAQALLAARIVGKRSSYATDNPRESQAVFAYMRGGPRPLAATAMGKHLVALEDARRAGYEPTAADTPQPPSAAALGGEIPTDIQDASGAVAKVSSLASLTETYATAGAGTIIDGGGLTFDLAGGTLMFTRGMAGTVEIRNVRVVNGGANGCVRVEGASYLRLRNVEASGGSSDGFKITSSAHHVSLVSCHAHDNAAQGFITSGGAHHWQMIGCKAIRNGKTSALDHNWYIAAMSDGCVVASCYGESPGGYNLQIQYSTVTGGLVTCCEFNGGTGSRGGIVLSTGAGKAKIIGCYVHDCQLDACHVYDSASGCSVYDSYEERTNGGWTASSGVTYVRTYSGPAGPIDSSQYGLVPPVDIDGKPRLAQPRAGAYA